MIRYFSQILLILITSAALTSCASIFTGTKQDVAVSTGKIQGAKCSLKNNKGKWEVQSTPAKVTVNRSDKALDVDCQKVGYVATHQNIGSNMNSSAELANAILPGGLIGASIDMANGAAYQYPDTVSVPLQKSI